MKELFENELNSDSEESKVDYQHAVLVHFINGTQGMEDHYTVGAELSRAIEQKGLGVYDFHEIAMDDSHGTLFMYGNNAEDLFKGVLPILKKAQFCKGATAVLRFGSHNTEVPEIEVDIDTA